MTVWTDPEIADVLETLPPIEFNAATLDLMRQLMPGPAPCPPDISRTDHVVSTGPSVVVTMHRPADLADALPCIYWIHGGGLVAGNRHMDDDELDRWCRALSCACVSVEYRLAPEHPYPSALDDCWAGLVWLLDQSRELRIDRDRVVIAGRSAGGGLAAAVALRARALGGPPSGGLLLEYAMLDDRQETPSSRTDGLAMWTRESNAFGWRSYLGEVVGTAAVPVLAAPGRATELDRLPPTCIVVGGADGFRDEDVTFAAALMSAGVPTELHVYPGAPHGFHVFAAAGVTARASRDERDWLARRFGGG